MDVQRSSRVVRLAGCGAIGLALVGGTPVVAEGIPESLEGFVLGDEKRPVFRSTINNVRFHSLRAFSVLPYVLWPADEDAPAPFDRGQAAVRAWLAEAAASLGYAGFDPVFQETFTWHRNEVWAYQLERNGMLFHDARVMVHWNGEKFLGIVNHMPGRIVEIDDLRDDALGSEQVYLPVRNEDRNYRLVVADLLRVEREDRVEVTIIAPDGSLQRSVAPRAASGGAPGDIDGDGDVDFADLLLLLGAWGRCEPMGPCPEDLNGDEVVGFADLLILLGNWGVAVGFEEWPMPVGSFPDQISVAHDGIVWLSQPNNNFFTSFDPATQEFKQYSTPGGSGPDGLIVGSPGRVWSGMYFSGSLGLLDADTGDYTDYPAPYGNAAMAIPVATTDGKVWVTDHLANRISEFDPETAKWTQSVLLPTQNSWVVQGYEDVANGMVYFTEYTAQQLGVIPLGGNAVTDIETPGGGPAFCVVSNGKVYYSRWSEVGIGVYDIETGQITEYSFPIPNENGGPMWIAPNGDVITGTRNQGYIMVFHPETETFDAYEIPTSNPGLKDGLTVGGDGAVWFTESGANKLARLILP